ncbi:hypothetical protein ACLK1T_06475 [Escherichia coli]
MNSLGDALKAANQHAKTKAIGQADMSACWPKSRNKLNNPTPAANRGRSRWC